MSNLTHRIAEHMVNITKMIDHNAFVFMNHHRQCSIWFKDFDFIEQSLRTFMRCTTCKEQSLIGEVTFTSGSDYR